MDELAFTYLGIGLGIAGIIATMVVELGVYLLTGNKTNIEMKF